MWRARRWRELLNLIDHLPRNSAYHEALVEDDDLAEVLATRPDVDRPPTRQMRDFSVEVELLSVLGDRIGELIHVVAATKGAKPKPLRPLPRPSSALQRLRARRRRAKHDSVVARLLPGRSKDANG